MSVLKIAQIGEPVLREVAQEVSAEELKTPQFQAFIDQLIDTMHDAKGAGLAANQVFRSQQVCAIEVRDNPRYPYKPNIPLTVLVNPTITVLGEEQFKNFEGCLSVPNLRGEVLRWAHVRVQAQDRHGAPIDLEVKGITAGTFQHEVDHLQGKIFVDRVQDPHTFCTWDSFQRHFEADFRKRVELIVARYGS